MAAYLIKSILCLLVLWGFYKVALEQTAAHHFKRFYLLGSLAIAIALPLVSFSYTVEVAPQRVAAETHFEPASFTEVPVTTPTAESTNWLLLSLALVYGAGVLLLGFRFLRNLLRLREKVRHNEHIKASSHINVLLLEQVVPHSFLKYIFLPKTDFKNNTLPAEVLQHEQAHVIQKHSWDILLIEFLQVVFWFNPVLMLLKKSVALNHEFLADQAALDQNKNLTNYTNLLFNYSGGAHHTALSSPINYSLTKKRILMLSKTRSVKKLTARIALFVPVLALCVYFFNQEIVAKPVNLQEPQKMEGQNNQASATSTDTFFKSDKPKVITQADLDALSKNPTYYILEKKVPTSSQLNEWKDASQYGVWVDGKRIKNANLKSAEAYSHYFISKLEKNAKNYGAHYFQVNLMTPSYYEDHTQVQNPPSQESIKAYLAQTEKVLNITVTGSDIYLNGKETTVETFANDIDALSKNWTLSEKKNYSVHVRSSNADHEVWKGLQKAFETTALYKSNPKGLVPPPPPPAPAPPKAGSIPPPPPPPSTNSSLEEVTVQGLPAPPPPPPAPEEMLRLAKDNIYYNDKKISAEKAQELIENSDAYNLMFNSNKGSHVLIIKDKN